MSEKKGRISSVEPNCGFLIRIFISQVALLHIYLLFKVVYIQKKPFFITCCGVCVFIFSSHLTAVINLTPCWRSVTWKATRWTPRRVCFTAQANRLQNLSSTLLLREELRAPRRVRAKPSRALPPSTRRRHSCRVNLRSASLPLPPRLYLRLLLSPRNSQSSESRANPNPRR